MTILLLLILGSLAGGLAARLVGAEALGLWGNIGVGIVGAVPGGILLSQMGVRLLGKK